MRSIGVVDELPESIVEEINEIIRQKNKKEISPPQRIGNGKFDVFLCQPMHIHSSMLRKGNKPNDYRAYRSNISVCSFYI